MQIYQMTEIGRSEAGTPSADPSDAKRVLYYLKKRANEAAADDMITAVVFEGDRGRSRSAISRLLQAHAVRPLG